MMLTQATQSGLNRGDGGVGRKGWQRDGSCGGVSGPGPGAQGRDTFQRRRAESSPSVASFSQAVATDWSYPLQWSELRVEALTTSVTSFGKRMF